MAAYRDPDWAASTRLRLAADAEHLDRLLHLAGLEPLGGTSLFRLARTPDAAGRFERLAGWGVLARPFAYAPDWLRFGLPPEDGWARLEAALTESVG